MKDNTEESLLPLSCASVHVKRIFLKLNPLGKAYSVVQDLIGALKQGKALKKEGKRDQQDLPSNRDMHRVFRV